MYEERKFLDYILHLTVTNLSIKKYLTSENKIAIIEVD